MAKASDWLGTEDFLMRPHAAESQLLHAVTSPTKAGSQRHSNRFDGIGFVSIDEVGRGCLAGPVVVCATAWRSLNGSGSPLPWVTSLRDSKKLSHKRREVLFTEMLTHLGDAWYCEDPPPLPSTSDTTHKQTCAPSFHIPTKLHKYTFSDVCRIALEKPRITEVPSFSMVCASIGSATSQEIDFYGLSNALNMAAQRALSRLNLDFVPELLFFDGNRPLKLDATWSNHTQCLVTKGDDCLKSISASSVLAKVVRDHWMDKYSQLFPDFGFSDNRGYGTESHRRALERAGPSCLHRHSFLKNILPSDASLTEASSTKQLKSRCEKERLGR
jgi:ribonuclease HII